MDYLTLRHHDVRPLQESLAQMGLSSLGRSEEHVMSTLERVLGILQMMAGKTPDVPTPGAVGHGEGREILEANAEALLGPSPKGRPTRIIVTMPTEAADDIGMVRGLIERGMDCARINCAHDDEAIWLRMVSNLRQAATEAGRDCPIVMDLPGPKLRTGPIEPGPQVVRLHPRRGRVGPTHRTGQSHVGGPGASDPRVRVRANRRPFPSRTSGDAPLRPGDRIKLHDARGSSRRFTVTEVHGDGVLVDVYDTTYFATGTRLIGPSTARPPSVRFPRSSSSSRCIPATSSHSPRISRPCPRRGFRSPKSAGLAAPTGTPQSTVPPRAATGSGAPCREPSNRCGSGTGSSSTTAGSAGRSSPSVPTRLTSGSRWPAPGGTKLRAEKGINLPDSDLPLPAMTREDEAKLPFIVEHADLVELSFAQRPSDVTALQERLADLGGSRLGVVLKVETARGFAQLPEMLLAGMGSERLGVMVARGDLAVECGFERLAEVQEEMLWLCDAAHVPVIWATQVLDQMARTGLPSRAEISDAAMAGRAECVLLNKGPHIAHAVATLDDILRRMASHQHKKVALLRRLRSWSPNPG